MDLKLVKQWFFGKVRPFRVVRGQPYYPPGLDYGEDGSRINFRDKFGNILFIEIDDDIMYVCGPGYTRKDRFPAVSLSKVKSFTATESKTEIDFQDAGEQFNSITIKNDDTVPVNVKVRQSVENYLIGSNSYYYTIAGSTTICITTFANPQLIDPQNNQDIVLEISGVSKNVTLYGLFTKIL